MIDTLWLQYSGRTADLSFKPEAKHWFAYKAIENKDGGEWFELRTPRSCPAKRSKKLRNITMTAYIEPSEFEIGIQFSLPKVLYKTTLCEVTSTEEIIRGVDKVRDIVAELGLSWIEENVKITRIDICKNIKIPAGGYNNYFEALSGASTRYKRESIYSQGNTLYFVPRSGYQLKIYEKLPEVERELKNTVLEEYYDDVRREVAKVREGTTEYARAELSINSSAKIKKVLGLSKDQPYKLSAIDFSVLKKELRSHIDKLADRTDGSKIRDINSERGLLEGVKRNILKFVASRGGVINFFEGRFDKDRERLKLYLEALYPESGAGYHHRRYQWVNRSLKSIEDAYLYSTYIMAQADKYNIEIDREDLIRELAEAV